MFLGDLIIFVSTIGYFKQADGVIVTYDVTDKASFISKYISLLRKMEIFPWYPGI